MTDIMDVVDKPLLIAQLGEPVLRQEAAVVEDFNSPELVRFIEQMLASMLTAGGVGIAAPQVFCSRQIMIIASKPNQRYPNAPQMQPLVMLNPHIKSQYGEVNLDWEGCLSVPGIRGWVPRQQNVEVNYQDRAGKSQFIRLNGFVARIFLHEYDHLIGLSFVDRVTDSQFLVAESVWKKILSGDITI